MPETQKLGDLNTTNAVRLWRGQKAENRESGTPGNPSASRRRLSNPHEESNAKPQCGEAASKRVEPRISQSGKAATKGELAAKEHKDRKEKTT
jgi:hypothetical protein